MAEDLKNKKFNKLTVINKLEERSSNAVLWLCTCECGNKTKVTTSKLKSGHTKSCGCWRKDNARAVSSYRDNTKHGQAKQIGGRQAIEYSIWCMIKSRCLNKKHKKYPDYGGRGITLCKVWREDFKKFAEYIRTLPNCPAEKALCNRKKGVKLNLSIDRIDNDGNYEPGNIKWSTQSEQNKNTRSNVYVTLYGELLTVTEACEKLKIVTPKIALSRIRNGWLPSKAISVPPK